MPVLGKRVSKTEPVVMSIDTECGGVDHYHGATHPFFVTVSYRDGRCLFWEWDVDPLTRKVLPVAEDVEEIRRRVAEADVVVGQNIKYDVSALHQSGIITDWPWEKTECTLMAGHLLASNEPHDLTSMARQYLGVDIGPLEDALHVACVEARRAARSRYPDWLIAREDLPGMPSVKGGKDKADRGVNSESPWAADMWLPRAVAAEGKLPDTHPWWTVLRDYSNADSGYTLPLWFAMEEELKRRGYWKIYRERRKLPRLAVTLEKRPVTVSKPALYAMRDRFKVEVSDASDTCAKIAAEYEVEQCVKCGKLSGTPTAVWDKRCKCPEPRTTTGPYVLDLPKGAVNDNLRSFCFNVMKLDHVVNPKAKTDAPTLDSKNAIPHYLRTLPKDSKPYQFISSFADRNNFTTAISYLNSYERYWLPLGIYNEDGGQLWYGLHQSLNPTGTDHLRWSSSNPNTQNISKNQTECRHCEGDGCGRCNNTGYSKASLRECFGPAPGREWWSLDAKNIERRIPAYEANERAIIELLEEPDKPPYYGSEHALVGHIVFPDEFESCRDAQGNLDGRIFKKRYKDTCYQRTKNFNFALQYQCGEATGDRTSGVIGSFKKVKSRFANQEALNKWCVDFAEQHGFIETIPDKEVDPDRGYPILCARGHWGRVLSTVPLNYRSSGTAMWWTCRAMVKVQGCLDDWNKSLPSPQYFMALQVHDELVLDFPKRADPRKNPRGSNLSRVREIQRLMESCGPPINTPTPVGIEYNPVNWAEGITF